MAIDSKNVLVAKSQRINKFSFLSRLTFCWSIVKAIGSALILCLAVRLESISFSDRRLELFFVLVARVQYHFKGLAFLNKLVRIEKSQCCRRDEPDSLRVVGKKTMFAVCYSGQYPLPSGWRIVNAMRHFQSVALSTEAYQRSTSGVRLTAHRYNDPSLDSPRPWSPFILACSLSFTYFSSGLHFNFLPSHTHTKLIKPRTQALAPSVGLGSAFVLVRPSFKIVCSFM